MSGVVNGNDDGDFVDIRLGEGEILRCSVVTKNEFIIKEIVENHSHTSGEHKNTGAFDKVKVKRKVNGGSDTEGKFIEWGKESEKPSKEWTDGKSSNKIPEEKFDDANFGGMTFSPSNFRMHEIGKEGGKEIRN